MSWARLSPRPRRRFWRELGIDATLDGLSFFLFTYYSTEQMTEEDYRQQIRKLDWLGLRQLWAGIKQKNTPGWAPGKALEYLILRAFELDGATVRYPFSINMDGEVTE